MPVSIVLELECLREAQLPAAHHRHVHGAAFQLLARHNQELAQEAHNSKKPAAITVSLLFQTVRDEKFPPCRLLSKDFSLGRSSIVITPGQKVFWRLTGLNDPVCEWLWSLRPSGLPVEIGKGLFGITGVAYDATAHRAAGGTTYDSLCQAPPVLPDKVSFFFLSPTSFRYGDSDYPLPTPRFLWGSVFDKWQVTAPRQFVLDRGAVQDYLDRTVIPVRWEGTTHHVNLGGTRRMLAFSGMFSYRFSYVTDEDMRYLLGVLSRFAFFSGVGRLTAQGFGQVFPVFLE